MRILHVKALNALSMDAREKLERIFDNNSGSSIQDMQALFPNHIVRANYGHIRVLATDGTIILDALRDGSLGINWVETKVPLKMTL